MSPVDCVLGLDGGGTGTRCVVASTDGWIVSRGEGGPSNPLTAGADEAAHAIMEAVGRASQRSGVEGFRVSVLGVAGTERERGRRALLERLPDSLGRVVMVIDAVSALVGATGGEPGVVVISGTGSISFGVNEKGESARSGGWGWMVGDEGSGYDIGRRAITAVLKAQDGRGQPTMLTEFLCRELGLKEAAGFIDWLYYPDRDSQEIAALAPLVSEAWAQGDTVASLILMEAGVELGHTAQAVIRELGLEGDFKVAVNGGVFSLEGPLRASFEEVVRRGHPDCEVTLPRFEPAVGSALLALKELGVELDEGLLLRVERSLRELGE